MESKLNKETCAKCRLEETFADFKELATSFLRSDFCMITDLSKYNVLFTFSSIL